MLILLDVCCEMSLKRVLSDSDFDASSKQVTRKTKRINHQPDHAISRNDDFSAQLSGNESDGGLEDIVFGRDRRLDVGKDDFPVFFIDKATESSGKRCVSAWEDDDDEDRDGKYIQPFKSRGMGNVQYQKMLTGDRRVEYEKVVGEAPAWASIPEDETVKNDKLMNTDYNYLGNSERLPAGVLDFIKCTDANKEQRSYSMEVCEFHKDAQISMTAGKDCRLNLFQVDGKYNAKIHSFFTENFPIKCAHFLKSGKEIFMTSNVKYFYNYDLISGKIVRVPFIKGTDVSHFKNFYVSPDSKHLIFTSPFGHMYIASASTKELIKTIRVNGSVRDVAFRNQGQQFLAYGSEGIVTIWDIRNNGCIHSFIDEGSACGTSLAVSPNSKYVACGSKSGIVNLYDEAFLQSGSPNPIKSFKNIQYATSCLKFDSTSDILGMSSADCDNTVKMVHVPSLTVFSNFPGLQNYFLKRVRCIDFSPHSGYMMLGNNRGRAVMFRLQHFKSY